MLGRKRLSELEVFSEEAPEKPVLAVGRVKKSTAGRTKSKLQRARIVKKCCPLKADLACFRGRLQTALTRVSTLKSHLGQQVVVAPSFKRKMVVAFKTQVAALQSQLKVATDVDGYQAEAVYKILQIGGQSIAVRGNLLTSLGLLDADAVRERHKVRNILQKVAGQL